MSETTPKSYSRIMTQRQRKDLYNEVLETALQERPEAVEANLQAVKSFTRKSINLIQRFERAARPHPQVHGNIDVVYIDSGPGPISYSLLQPGKTDLEDVNYHQFPWSRKMDRARTHVAYALASEITRQRVNEENGTSISARDLTTKDFDTYGPDFMYTSTTWQNEHANYVRQQLAEQGLFKIPSSKIVMYDTYTKQGEAKKIIHTEDQIEGLQFRNNADNTPPRAVAIVSHPAHLMRIMHILGHYPESIPKGTSVIPFPIPTPYEAVMEYARAELLGTLGTIFSRKRASFTPYKRTRKS